MNTDLKPRRLRIPVHYVDGAWEFQLGGAIPVKEGTEGELVIDPTQITDKVFLRAMTKAVKHKVLGEGASFLVSLAIKPRARLSEELLPFLKSFSEFGNQIATMFLPSFNPGTLHFVSVSLSKPRDSQIRTLETRDGGLWLVTQGLKTTAIESTTVILPPPVAGGPAASLNHALTLLSEAYETDRLSHTGNVYSRVLYQGYDKRWYPLDLLRKATLEDQAHAIGGELWDEFMRKMRALRDKSKRK